MLVTARTILQCLPWARGGSKILHYPVVLPKSNSNWLENFERAMARLEALDLVALVVGTVEVRRMELTALLTVLHDVWQLLPLLEAMLAHTDQSPLRWVAV